MTVADIYECEICDGEAKVLRWPDEEPTVPSHPKCNVCAVKTSPDYIKRQKEIRSHNEAVNRSHEAARQLGTLVHEAFLVARRATPWFLKLRAHSTDHCLLDTARTLYATNETFRTLWNEVKGDEPSEKDLKWLRLWKRL
jgi:hypothetical protein